MDESLSFRLRALELREAEVKRREYALWDQEHELRLESSRVRLQSQELAEEKRELNETLAQLLGYDKQQSIATRDHCQPTNTTSCGSGYHSTISIAISAINQRHNEDMTTTLAREADLTNKIDELQIRADYDECQIADANIAYAKLQDKSSKREERLLWEVSAHSHNEYINYNRALIAEADLEKVRNDYNSLQGAHQELGAAYAGIEMRLTSPAMVSDHDSDREEPKMEYVQIPCRNPPRNKKRVV